MQRLEVSGAVRPIYGSLGVKWLTLNVPVHSSSYLRLCCYWLAFGRCQHRISIETSIDLTFYIVSPQFVSWRSGPTRTMASSFLKFLDYTRRRSTVGRSPLDEWSACRRDLYRTSHYINKRQASRPPAGFEPTISARFPQLLL